MSNILRPVDVPEPSFSLTPAERDTALWRGIEEYLAGRLDRARRTNDNPQSPEETAMLRGEIRCLKSILRLGKDRPPQGG